MQELKFFGATNRTTTTKEPAQQVLGANGQGNDKETNSETVSPDVPG
jgi:hypothetical protein